MEIVPVLNLQAFKPEKQRIRVCVCRIWRPRLSDLPEKYGGLHCILVDEKQNAIEAYSEEANYEMLSSKIEAGNCYDISHFNTNHVKSSYKVVAHDVEISLTPKTVFTPVSSIFPSIPRHRFYLFDYNLLRARLDRHEILTDVLGHITGFQRLETKLINNERMEEICNVEIENIRKEIAKITLRSNVAKSFASMMAEEPMQPIIVVFTSLKVKQYQGEIVLSNSASSLFFIDPDIPELNAYRASFSNMTQSVKILPPSNKQIITSEQMQKMTIEDLSYLDPDLYKDDTFLCSEFISRFDIHRASTSAPVDFVQCLLNHSPPSHPIAPAIYTSDAASYCSVLESYIRNLRFNTSSTRKPYLIITALHESHVQVSVLCAQLHNLHMKIRSGGHDYEGVSYVAKVPFFILDMSNLRSIDVDIKSETAWVQAGATLGEVYYRIAEKSKVHGFPAGVCPTVGVGGHFSGGGYGNMMRKYGLSVDNIVDAQIVDVHGKLLDRKSMGEDLFWAITGGGGASFGVVIAYKINLVRVPETVTVFRVERTLEQNATDIVDRWQYVADKLDHDLFIRLTMDIVNATTSHSSNGGNNKTLRASFIALFLGDSKRLLALMNKSFPELGLKQSDCSEMSWVESILFWTSFPKGTATDALLSRTPQVLTHLKRKSDYVKKPIPKSGLKWIFQKMIELETPMMTFNPCGGKMSEIPASATPFPHRAGNLWKVQYATNWNTEGDEASDYYIDLTRKLFMYMTPFVSKNPRGAFFNYKDLDIGINHNVNAKRSYLEGRVYGVKYFKDNFDRLVHVKTKVDPGNFFRNEQSIPTLPY